MFDGEMIFGSTFNKKYLKNKNFKNNQNYITNNLRRTKMNSLFYYKILKKDSSIFYLSLFFIIFILLGIFTKNINNIETIKMLLIIHVFLYILFVFLYKVFLQFYINTNYYIVELKFFNYKKIKSFNENEFYNNFIVFKK